MPAVVQLPGAVEQKIKEEDEKYLEKHNVKALMHQLLTDIVKGQPKDPVQYLIDVLSFENPDDAVQDPLGLSAFRKRKLLEVFSQMDKNGDGVVAFKEVQAHTSRYGGGALTDDELKEIFKDFDTSGDNKISIEEFLLFFSRAVANQDNEDFDRMIGEMLD